MHVSQSDQSKSEISYHNRKLTSVRIVFRLNETVSHILTVIVEI